MFFSISLFDRKSGYSDKIFCELMEEKRRQRWCFGDLCQFEILAANDWNLYIYIKMNFLYIISSLGGFESFKCLSATIIQQTKL